jgi:hypothetical protein
VDYIRLEQYVSGKTVNMSCGLSHDYLYKISVKIEMATRAELSYPQRQFGFDTALESKMDS